MHHLDYNPETLIKLESNPVIKKKKVLSMACIYLNCSGSTEMDFSGDSN